MLAVECPVVCLSKLELFTRHFLTIIIMRNRCLFSTYFSSSGVNKNKKKNQNLSSFNRKDCVGVTLTHNACAVILTQSGDHQWNFSPHLIFISLVSCPVLFVLLHHLCLFNRVTLLICCLHCSFHWGLLNSSLLHISCRYVARAS